MEVVTIEQAMHWQWWICSSKMHEVSLTNTLKLPPHPITLVIHIVSNWYADIVHLLSVDEASPPSWTRPDTMREMEDFVQNLGEGAGGQACWRDVDLPTFCV
jgi:hypothetical protein